MTHRIFIAINLPQDVKDELNFVLSSLKKKLKRTAIKWVNNNFHLTLHFLGNLEDDEIEKVSKILETTVQKYPKAQLKLGQIGFFPNTQRPRVVFVNTTDSIEIRKLQTELGRELREAGFNIDSRPWQPHLTLGRIHGPIAIEVFKKQEIKPIEFKMTSIELMESELKPDGAVYRILKSFPLS